ncbi:hypothetical protein [Merismopedia glauca]|uniref:hypothetical protein n=1 Tax=Merismopedia glauca TaxID=292586 RepID=UPI0011B28529|nr:hypothetical protein [Merismopedia glauca]
MPTSTRLSEASILGVGDLHVTDFEAIVRLESEFHCSHLLYSKILTNGKTALTSLSDRIQAS